MADHTPRRANAKDDLRARARDLRAAGASYNEIAAALGVSKSSCSLWLRDMPRPITAAEQTRRSVAARAPGRAAHRAATDTGRRTAKLAAAREIGDLTDRDVLLAGAIVYWCEGAKARTGATRVSLTNTDPALIGLFLRFLHVAGVERDRVSFRLEIHETADAEDAERFWRETTGPTARFTRPLIKKTRETTNRRNTGPGYHGCLNVQVARSDELYCRIAGWALGVMLAGRDGPADLADVADAFARHGRVGGRRIAEDAADRARFEERSRRARALRDEGRSWAQIRDELGVSPSTVGRALADAGPPLAYIRAWEEMDRRAEQAIELCARGHTAREAAERVGVSVATVRRWVSSGRRSYAEVRERIRAGRDAYEAAARAGRAAVRAGICAAAAREVGRLTEREVLLLGSLAYWCEGGKDKSYRVQEHVDFINSDPHLLRFFLEFLRTAGVGRAAVTYRVAIHESGDLAGSTEFWAALAGVEAGDFMKPVLKRHAPKIRYEAEERRYRGCLRIGVGRSADLYRRIEGWALGAMLGPAAASARWADGAAEPDNPSEPESGAGIV
ncbi:helix-turn-helix domain-containing protein [Actinomadura atramentaria]|uniref:helix-turn-helix domain-containing protein n=1 Tax=Actinomadura atramentaria TaxID=1990 RepID=UPI0003771D93|nr:helix-turn-helix domain-containing protein [Actinomadura atramentaria]